MSILNMHFVVYERLASAKMETMVSAINAHTHDGSYGVQIPYSYIAGQLDAGDFPTGVNAIITGDMIVNGSLDGTEIAAGAITYNHLDETTIHLDANGYAVYAA